MSLQGKPDLNTALPVRQTASIFKQPVTKITNHPSNKVKSDPQKAVEQPRQVSTRSACMHTSVPGHGWPTLLLTFGFLLSSVRSSELAPLCPSAQVLQSGVVTPEPSSVGSRSLPWPCLPHRQLLWHFKPLQAAVLK